MGDTATTALQGIIGIQAAFRVPHQTLLRSSILGSYECVIALPIRTAEANSPLTILSVYVHR